MQKYLYVLYLFVLVSCGNPGTDLVDGISTSDHRVFITSTLYYPDELGSLTQADSLCKTVATNQGLKLTYKAILSDDSTYASNRLEFTGSIYKVDSDGETTLIASTGSDLWNTDTSNLFSSINLDESGAELNVTPWTGTNSNGATSVGSTCSSWSTTSGSGFVGSTSSTGAAWLENFSYSCSQRHPIYCISQ